MRPQSILRGCGALTVEERDRALVMVRSGFTMSRVAARFRVTKNTIAGLWHRHGEPVSDGPEPGTLFGRMDALHARLDAVLAETVGVGRLSEAEVERRKAEWRARQ